MAIFASTTTSGYSDPLKALSIKALEQRQKDLLAQQAQQTMPDAIPTPIQGLAHVANQFADSLQQRRADTALAARRDQLAQVMAGIGPEGPNAQQRAIITSADPELGKLFAQQVFEARQKAADRAQETELQKSKFGFEGGQLTQRLGSEEKRASEVQAGETGRLSMGITSKEQQAALDRAAADEQLSSKQEHDAIMARLNAGLAAAQKEKDYAQQNNLADRAAKADQDITQFKADLTAQENRRSETFQAQSQTQAEKAKSTDLATKIASDEKIAAAEAAAKAAQVKTGNIKGETESKNAYTQHAQEISNLERAQKYMNEGIYTGTWAGAKAGVTNVFEGMVGDKAKAQRTTNFNSIINADTIKRMSETLKGASTDFEMRKFIEVYNNPNASDSERKTALDNLVTAAKISKGIHAEAVRKYGGNTDEIDAQLAKSGAAGSGATAEVKAVGSEAEALTLPPNTKFRLPDGRTGTTR
jgi:hypothetical protein